MSVCRHTTFSDRFLEWASITQHFRIFLSVNAPYTQKYEAFSTEVCNLGHGSRLHLSSKRDRLDLSAHIRWIQEKAIIHYHTASAWKEGDARTKREKKGVEAGRKRHRCKWCDLKTHLAQSGVSGCSRFLKILCFPCWAQTRNVSLFVQRVINLGSCQQLVLLISLFSWETRSASWLSFDFTEMRFSPKGWQHSQCLSSKNSAFKS